MGGPSPLPSSEPAVSTHYAQNLSKFTVSLWVQGNAPPTTASDTVLVQRGTNFTLFWDSTKGAAGGAVVSVAAQPITVSFGNALTTPGWHLLDLVCDGTMLAAYTDGQKISSVAITGQPDASSAPFTMGGTAAGAANGATFTGLIDEVRLATLSYSAAEVQADYLSTTDQFCSYGVPEALP
jgi:hypothetical protein